MQNNLTITPETLNLFLPVGCNFENEQVRQYLLERLHEEVSELLELVSKYNKEQKINVLLLKDILGLKGYKFCF